MSCLVWYKNVNTSIHVLCWFFWLAPVRFNFWIEFWCLAKSFASKYSIFDENCDFLIELQFLPTIFDQHFRSQFLTTIFDNNVLTKILGHNFRPKFSIAILDHNFGPKFSTTIFDQNVRSQFSTTIFYDNFSTTILDHIWTKLDYNFIPQFSTTSLYFCPPSRFFEF